MNLIFGEIRTLVKFSILSDLSPKYGTLYLSPCINTTGDLYLSTGFLMLLNTHSLKI